MKKFGFLHIVYSAFFLLILAGCGGGGGSPSNDAPVAEEPVAVVTEQPDRPVVETPPPVVEEEEVIQEEEEEETIPVTVIGGTTTVVTPAPQKPKGEGKATKGPFRKGSKVVAYELNTLGVHTGESVETNTTDDKGTFEIILTWKGATEIIVTGDYLDEDTGEYLSDGKLSAVLNIGAGKNNAGVNLLTTIAAGAAKKKMGEGKSINEAKDEASDAVKEIFDLDAGEKLELLDVVSTGKGNGQLLKFSAAFTKMDDPAGALDDIVDGIGDDGELGEDAKAALEEVKEKAKEIDPVAVVENLKGAFDEKDGVTPPDLGEADGTLSWEHSISFEDTTDAFRETAYTSNEIVVSGVVGDEAPISIVGGKYSIDGAEFNDTVGTISNGQLLKVEVISSNDFEKTVTATLKIGKNGVEIPYSVTTQADPFVADAKVNRFKFKTIRKQPVGVPVTSETIVITGINVPVPISIENGEYDINGTGIFKVVDGMITSDSNLTIRHNSASEYGTKKVTIITIGEGNNAVRSKFKSKTVAKDTKPDEFKLVRQNNVKVNSWIESESVDITGINAEVAVRVENGEYRIGSGSWTTEEGSVSEGYTLQVRQKSSADYNKRKTTFLRVGKRVAKFITKTESDTREMRADEFKFKTLTDQNRTEDVISDEIIVSGINVAVPISIDYGTFDINGSDDWVTEGNVTVDSIVRIKHTTANDFKTPKISTLTIGEGINIRRGEFKTVTERKDEKPDAFSFDDNMSVPSGTTEVFSNEINISGINTQVKATIKNGEFDINNTGSWTTDAMVSLGDKIRIKQVPADAQGKKKVSTLTVGRMKASFRTRIAVNAPEISGTPDSTVSEGSLYRFEPTVNLDTGGKVKAWSIANKPDWLIFNSRNGRLLGKPTINDIGKTEHIVITASNGTGDDNIDFNLTVTNKNGGLLAFDRENTIPTARVAQDSNYTAFTPVIIGESTSKTFALSHNPDWMVIDEDNGTVSGTLSADEAFGTFSGITITVTDSNGLPDTFTFSVTVTAINHAPTISGDANITVAQDALYSFTPSVTDTDSGDTQSFDILNMPTWASFDTATGTLSGVPTNDDIGTTTGIVITVTDGFGASDSLTPFNIEVTNVNDAPSIFGLPQTAINERELFPAFTPTVVDIDAGDTKTFAITGKPDWLNFDTTSGALTSGSEAIFNGGGINRYDINITVIDGGGLSDSLTFTLAVLNVNDAPTLVVIPNTTIDEDTNATVGLVASDPDGNETIFFNVDINDSRVKAEVKDSNLNLVPDANFNGIVSVKVIVSDGKLDANQTFDLIINPIDDAPVLEDIADVSIIEDGNISFDVNATDVEGDEITYTATSSDTEALSAVVNGSTVTLSALNNLTGDFNVTVTATANGLSDSKTIRVTVTPVNDAPILAAIDDSEFDEDTNLTIELNATDADGDGVVYDANSSDVNVTVEIVDNELTLMPSPDFYGDVNISVWATDDSSDALVSNIETFVASVLPINDAPIAYDVNGTTNEENATAITLIATDIDSNVTALEFVIESNATDGNVTIVNNIATYTPALDFVGTDSFTYTAYDGNLTSNIATVTIEVANINDAPVLADINSSEVDEDATPFVIELNATDVDGDALSYEANSSDESIATVEIVDNQLTVTPQPDMNGEITISVVATDGTLSSEVKEFTINILPVNDAPVLSGVSAQNMDEDSTPLVIELNATDVDGDALSYEANSSDITKATTAISGNQLTITPQPDMNGDVTIILSANDGNLTSNVETFVLTINPVNDAPILSPIAPQSMDEDSAPITVELNATDVDLDTLSYSVVSLDTDKATATIVGNVITIDSAENMFGTVNMIATVSDGNGADDNQSFVLTINPVNDAPTITDISVETAEDTQLPITLTATDIDSDLSDLVYAIESNASNGKVTLNGAVVTYTPDGNFTGEDSFTYSVFDGNLTSNIATVSIVVTAVNDAPILAPIDDMNVSEDASEFRVDLNVTDVDEGESFTYEVNSSDVTKATVVADSDTNELIITPLLDQNGEITITVTANDGEIDSNTETFKLTITPVNDAPVLAPIPAQSADEDSGVVTIELNATDVDLGDSIRFDVNSSDSNISDATISGTILTLTPKADMFGVVTIGVTAYDDANASDSTTFTFTINSVNDAPELQAIDNQTADEDAEAFIVELNATDIEGDALTYEANSSNDSLASLAISGSQLIITPLPNMFGEATISVVANDANVSNVQSFTLTINPVNDAPILEAIANQTALEDADVFSVDFNASDIDGDALSYEVNSSDSSIVVATIVGEKVQLTPQPNMFGEVIITVIAKDSNLSDTKTFMLDITPVNDTPIFIDPADMTVDEDNGTVVIELNATDIDGDNITYSVTSFDADKTEVTIDGSQLRVTPKQNVNGVLNIGLIANDGTIDSNPQTFVLTITAVNDAPIISLDDTTVRVEQDTPLSITPIVVDPDLNDTTPDTHTFTLNNAPAWMSVDSVTGEVRGTPTNDDINITNNIELNVTDSAGASDGVLFSVEVIDKNDAPTIEGTPDTNVSVGTEYSFIPTANDADANNTLTFIIDNKPDWAEFNETTGELKGIPMFVNIGESEPITISVTDELNTTALDSFTISVFDEGSVTALPVELPLILSDIWVDEDCYDGNCSKTYVVSDMLLSSDNLEYFTEQKLDENGSFIPNGEEELFLSKNGWLPDSDGKAFRVQDNFVDWLDLNVRMAVTSIDDISGEDINISGLMVKMPTDAKRYTLNIREYGDEYWLWKPVTEGDTNNTYDSLDTFMDAHCEESHLINRNDNNRIGLNLVGDGNGDCNISASFGILQEVNDDDSSANVSNAGFWVKKTINGEEILALYPTIEGYADEDEDENASAIFAVYDDGSGDKVFEGEESHHNGVAMVFPMYNSVAIDAIKQKIVDNKFGVVARFTTDYLNGKNMWSIHSDFNETTGEAYFGGGTWSFTDTHLQAQKELVATIDNPDIDTDYNITNLGQLAFFNVNANETSYLTIIEDNREDNMTLCWSDTSVIDTNCSRDFEFMLFSQSTAQTILDSLNSNAILLPDGYVYRAINNSDEEVETTIDIDGVSYIVKLYADYEESANDQSNHTGIVVRVNGEDAPTMQIQETYRTKNMVAALYQGDLLVATSTPVEVDSSDSITVIEMSF